MARKRKKKFNPTGLETGLLSVGAALLGSVGGFMLASYACGKLIQGGVQAGVIQPGPNAGPVVEEAMGAPQPGGI